MPWVRWFELAVHAVKTSISQKQRSLYNAAITAASRVLSSMTICVMYAKPSTNSVCTSYNVLYAFWRGLRFSDVFILAAIAETACIKLLRN